jgi:hypothetical protein
MGLFIEYLLSFLPFVSRKRYDDAVRLNALAKCALERWADEEKRRSHRNHLLHLHNAMLRDLLLRRELLEDTSHMVESVQGMIGDMQMIVEEARDQEHVSH